MLSYFAYSSDGFQENLWLITIEYSIVYGFMIYELLQRKKINRIPA